MSKRYKYKPNTFRRKWHSHNIPLKAWHSFLIKLRQLFCLHGDYVYLEITTQRKPEGGKSISFCRGCKKCGWVSHNGGYGMPKLGRNSYDRTYLKITDKNDVLLSDIKARKEKRELYEKFDKEHGTNWVSKL